MSRPEISSVAVFSKPHAQAEAVLRRLSTILRRNGVEMLVDPTSAESLDIGTSMSREEAVERAQLVVSVGGDGTLLATARVIGAKELPILGVNLGNLGFLTETSCDAVDAAIQGALEGQLPIEKRQVLCVSQERTDPAPRIALNDVVFSKSDLARLFTLSVLVNNEWVTDFRSDGLILATPTGSTAYSLAAGGPVVTPKVDALVINPICPHSLSQRPIILSGDSIVTVVLPEIRQSKNVQVTLDGQVGFPIEAGDRITIRRADHDVHLIRPTGVSFFSVLRDKLGWGQR